LFYVTSVDGNKESLSERVAIQFIAFNADFSVSPNPLSLEHTNTVKLTDLSENGVDWKWYFNDALVELVQSPVLHIDTVATYDVKLVVEDEQGCFAEIVKTLEVKEVTGLAELEQMGIVFYPNPSEGILQLEIREDLQLKVMSLAGQQLLQFHIDKSKTEIDLTVLQNGIYIVNFSNREINLNGKILIEK